MEDEEDSAVDEVAAIEADVEVVSREVVAEVSLTSPRLQPTQRLGIRGRRSPQCLCALL